MIEVILREDVKSLGQAGDMVRVKPGYARNYLLPKGLAYTATEGNKKRIAAETRALGVRLAAEKGGAERLAEALKDIALTLPGKVGLRIDHGSGCGQCVGNQGLRDRQAEDRTRPPHQDPRRPYGDDQTSPGCAS